MICKSLISVLIVSVAISQSMASEQARLIVKQHPSHHVYDYTTSGDLKLSEFKEILLAANGFSINEKIEWKGLKSTNSLAVPKLTLLFLVGNESGDALEGKSIPIDEDVSVNFEYLHNYYDSSNSLVKTFESLPTQNELKDIETECSNSLNSVLFVFQVSESDKINLKENMAKIIDTFSKNCVADKANDMLVYVLSTNNKQRVRRDAEPAKRAIGNTIINRAVLYSDNYPVTFHLLFWTSLILGLVMVSISCGMCNMDPGLDTVIYRMTSQRIKKDN